ncbi:hypothetical protein NS380_21710, partial [Pantoea dispersa]
AGVAGWGGEVLGWVRAGALTPALSHREREKTRAVLCHREREKTRADLCHREREKTRAVLCLYSPGTS